MNFFFQFHPKIYFLKSFSEDDSDYCYQEELVDDPGIPSSNESETECQNGNRVCNVTASQRDPGGSLQTCVIDRYRSSRS